MDQVYKVSIEPRNNARIVQMNPSTYSMETNTPYVVKMVNNNVIPVVVDVVMDQMIVSRNQVAPLSSATTLVFQMKEYVPRTKLCIVFKPVVTHVSQSWGSADMVQNKINYNAIAAGVRPMVSQIPSQNTPHRMGYIPVPKQDPFSSHYLIDQLTNQQVHVPQSQQQEQTICIDLINSLVMTEFPTVEPSDFNYHPNRPLNETLLADLTQDSQQQAKTWYNINPYDPNHAFAAPFEN